MLCFSVVIWCCGLVLCFSVVCSYCGFGVVF